MRNQADVRQGQASMLDMQYRVMVSDGAGRTLETTFTHLARLSGFSTKVLTIHLRISKFSAMSIHDSILPGTPWRWLDFRKKATELALQPLCFVQRGVIADRLVCGVTAVHLKRTEKSIVQEMQSKTGTSLFTADDLFILGPVALAKFSGA